MILASATTWLLWFDGPFAMRLMQSLLHFVWQGSLIAGLYATFAWHQRGSAANRRYAAGFLSLGLMIVCVPATFLAIGGNQPRATDDNPRTAAVLPPVSSAAGVDFVEHSKAGGDHEIDRPSAGPSIVLETATEATAARTEIGDNTDWIAATLPYASGTYFCGVTLMLARLGMGVWGGRRLRLAAVPCGEPRIMELLARLSRQIGLRAAPRIAWCARLAEPVVVGVLRPTILLPTALVSGLSADQLQAILLHELAHVQRYDLLANLLQRLIEVVLFFHPAVWWLSRRVTIERENACDDVVLRLDCPRIQYAEALVRVAELSADSILHARNRIVQLAATGGHKRHCTQFKRRVLRVLGSEDQGNLRLTPSPIGLVLLLLAGAVLAPAAWRHSVHAEAVANAPAAAETKDQPAAPVVSLEVAQDPAPAPPEASAVTSVEKPAVAAGSDGKTALSFERDPLQITPNAFDVWSLSFSANDQFLAAGGGGGWNDANAGQARIWDFGKAKEIASYPTMRGIATASLSPDAQRVALGSWSGDIWMREVGGAELLHEKFNWHVRTAFSPDGKLLVGVTEGGQLRTWDGVTGRPFEKGQGAFHGGSFRYFWVGFSPDGKYLVACGGKHNDVDGVKFEVWSVASRQLLYKKTAGLEPIYSASISPDSQTLATSGETSVVLWDLPTGLRRNETEDTGGAVYRVEFSPDGKLLASTSNGNGTSGGVTLWNAATGKAVGALTGHEHEVRALAFTHDGRTLVTGGSDRTIRLWDVASRRQTGTLQGSSRTAAGDGTPTTIRAIAYSADGASVATAGEDGEVIVHGPAPSGLSRSWTAHADAVAALAFAPDGKTLVTAGYDKVIKFWNLANGELLRSLSGHTGWVVSLAFSHDGQTLASGSYDRSIRLWNVADGLERHKLAGHTATIRSLAFSHNDKLLASASADQTVRLWNTADGEEQATLAGHENGVRSVAFSLDDRLLASGGEDQTIKIWNIASRDLRGTLTGHTDMVSGVAFAQQTLVSAGWDRTIRTWDADALESRAKLTAGPSEVVALAVASDGRHLLTAGADQSVTLWRSTVVEGRRSGSLGEYRTFPWAADFSPDGASVAVAAGGFDEETDLYLYDVATTAEKHKVTFPGSVRSIAFAPAGDVLALGFAKKRLLLVDAATGREVAQLEDQPVDAPPARRFRFARVAFSADGKLLAASSYDDDIRIYDVARRKLVKTLRGHKDRVLAFVFSPDQKQLVSCSAGKPAVVWDLENSERRYSLPTQPGHVGVASVSYSPDGRRLATGFSNDICCLWNAETGSLLQTFKAHDGIVFEAVFSPDGKILATAGEDGLVKLWDTATAELVRTYNCQPGGVLYVRFSPDGKSFVTAGREGQARLWWVLPPEKK